MRPVEGTILTVVREAAEAAEAAAGDGGAARRRARGGPRPPGADALDAHARAAAGAEPRPAWSTPAAPASCCCSTPACTWSTAGRCPSRRRRAGRAPTCSRRWTPPAPTRTTTASATCATRSCTSSRRPTRPIPAFKDVWAGIGDSIVVVGGDGIWNCHIHTDDIGAADRGGPRRRPAPQASGSPTCSSRSRRSAGSARPAPAAAEAPRRRASRSPTAVVAVAAGDGIRRIFHSLGVQRIVAGGQSMNPSTAELLEAVEAAPADEVVILPNNKNIIPVAEQVDAQTDKTVRVVPTRGVAEGFAALLAYDPEADADDNADGDGRGRRPRRRRRGHPGGARLDAATSGPIAEGDCLGLARDGIRGRRRRRWPAPPPALLDAAASATTTRSSPSSRARAPTAGDTRRITEWLARAPPRRRRPRSTTAASRSTRTSSASSSRPRGR